MNELTNDDYVAAELNHQTAQEKKDFNLFEMLKPELVQDGNQWCVLYGKDLQEGIAGFGNSPHLAILNFNNEFYKSIKDKSKDNGTNEMFKGTLDALGEISIK